MKKGIKDALSYTSTGATIILLAVATVSAIVATSEYRRSQEGYRKVLEQISEMTKPTN